MRRRLREPGVSNNTPDPANNATTPANINSVLLLPVNATRDVFVVAAVVAYCGLEACCAEAAPAKLANAMSEAITTLRIFSGY